MAENWLVVGLGNPGDDYAATRHNVGFMAADLLASRMAAKFKRAAKHRALVATSGPVVLAKPQTFMNDSGAALASLSRYYDVPLERVVVIFDDLDLEFAKLRVRVGGGTAGHNGLRSIVSAIGAEFVRVKIGIGRPPGRQEPVDFVLAPFAKREREDVDAAIERAADAVETILRDGPAAAQNVFN